MKKPKKPKPKHKPQPQTPPLPPTAPASHRKKTIPDLLGSVSKTTGFGGRWDYLLPSWLWRARYRMRLRESEICPDAVLSQSWDDLPITAKNASNLFGSQFCKWFFCEVAKVTWKGLEGASFVNGEHPVLRLPTMIKSGQTVTFPCDISKITTAKMIITHKEDGSTQEVQFPIASFSIRLSIKTKYKLRVWPWEREAISQEFTWRAVPGGYQWFEGDMPD